MNKKYTLGLLAMAMSATVMAQEVDDMYFNSKDRVVVNASREVALTKRYQQEDVAAVKNRPVNPSDSYSGRGVNPEYNAQGKNGTAVIQNNPDYFVSNFQPKSVNKNLYDGAGSYSNCNCASNPYYGMGGYSGYGNPYGMYSPYGMSPYGMSPYSSFYSPYSSMYSPYGMYGSPYGMSGMSMMMGYGTSFGMSSLYSAFGYGYGSMVPIGYVPSGYTTVVTGYDSRATVQGRRSSRSSSLNNYVDNTRANATGVAIVGTNGRVRDNGRTSQPDYYDRSWRNNPDNLTRSSWFNPNSGTGSSSWGGSNTSSGWDNGSRGRYSYDAFGSGSSGGTRSSMGSSGGGFSGGSSGGGSVGGGGGHSRGRN